MTNDTRCYSINGLTVETTWPFLTPLESATFVVGNRKVKLSVTHGVEADGYPTSFYSGNGYDMRVFDVVSRIREERPVYKDDGGALYSLAAQRKMLEFPGVVFVLSGEGLRDVEAVLLDNEKPWLVEAAFLWTVLAFISEQNGAVCLHASGIVCNGKALLVAGRQGIGKTTLAWALPRDAWLADDVVACWEAGSGFVAAPGTAGVFVDGEDARTVPWSLRPLLTVPKMAGGFTSVGAVVVLSPSLTSLALMRCSVSAAESWLYDSLFMPRHYRGPGSSVRLRRLAQMAHEVPVFRLPYAMSGDEERDAALRAVSELVK